MSKYNQSAKEAEKMIKSFIRNRMDDLEMTVVELADQSGVNYSAIYRWLNTETSMGLNNHLKILGVLKIHPYWKYSEDDDTEMERIFFN